MNRSTAKVIERRAAKKQERGERPRLSTEEQLRLAHLLASGFSPIAAANVLIATRGIGRLA
jgi:hypothetical protein